MPHGSLCLQELKYYIFQGNLCIRGPQTLQGICASKSSRYYILGNLCLQALAEPTPLLATLPDHWLHSCQSRWPNFGTPHSQNRPVKECCFVPRGICGAFVMKFLVATFHGNSRMKMSENYDQNFDAFFDPVSERISLSGIMFIKKLWKSTDSCRFLCPCLVTYTHRRTHKKKNAKRGKTGNGN